MVNGGGNGKGRSQQPPPEESGAPEPRDTGQEMPSDRCPLCGSAMTAVRCELICSNCGYREDCSDIFPAS